jgi:hypothetical protein
VLLKLSDVLRSMLRNRELLKWLSPKWVWRSERTEWIPLYILLALIGAKFHGTYFFQNQQVSDILGATIEPL